MEHRILAPRTDFDPSHEQLVALEGQVRAREQALDAYKRTLQALQTRYLAEVGSLYAELGTLDAAIASEEIRAGIRPPPPIGADDGDPDPPDVFAASSCGNRAAPSTSLKDVFRHVARAVHPDLGRDDAARYRRHSLMAEANRAYAERDEDRLRLILRVWESSPEAVVGDDPEARRLRAQRRLAELTDHLNAIEAEFADLRDSAIARLERKIEGARAQGWDLFAEMLRQIEREIATGRAKLARLRPRSRPAVPSAAP